MDTTHTSQSIDRESSDRKPKRWLIAIAAIREFEAIARGLGFSYAPSSIEPWKLISVDHKFDLVYTGVGKSNASGAVSRVLDTARHIGVLSAGIGGALPDQEGAYQTRVLDVVCASSSIFADEGIQLPDRFDSCAQMGFPSFPNGSDRTDHPHDVVELFRSFSDHVGSIACVSTCSGTDDLARSIAHRTGALAEAMEGASAALATRRISNELATGELRVISNRTGDRDNQGWDLDGAFEKLEWIIGQVSDRV